MSTTDIKTLQKKASKMRLRITKNVNGRRVHLTKNELENRIRRKSNAPKIENKIQDATIVIKLCKDLLGNSWGPAMPAPMPVPKAPPQPPSLPPPPPPRPATNPPRPPPPPKKPAAGPQGSQRNNLIANIMRKAKNMQARRQSKYKENAK